MSRLLTIPSEIRLNIFRKYLEGIEPCLSIYFPHEEPNSNDEDERDDEDDEELGVQTATTFCFEECVAPTVVKRFDPVLLRVCHQLRNEFLDYLASVQLRISPTDCGHGWDLPPDNLRFFDNGYADRLSEANTCSCFHIPDLPLGLFPNLKKLEVKHCPRQGLDRPEGDEDEWTLDDVNEEDIVLQVEDQAFMIHEESMEKFGSALTNDDCVLDVKISFGHLSVDVTSLKDGKRRFVKNIKGPIIVS